MIPAPIRRALAAWQSWRRRRRLARAYPELDALRQRRAVLSRQHRSTRHADAAIRRAMTMHLAHECGAMEPDWVGREEP